MTNHRYFMIKNPLFLTIHNNNGILLSQWPYPRVQSVDREPIVYKDNKPSRMKTCDDDTSLFLA